MIKTHIFYKTEIETKLVKKPWGNLNTDVILTFKNMAFDFINLPKIVRSKEACNNLPSNFDISDRPP